MFAFWKENRINGVKPVIHTETGLNRLGFREKELEKLSDDDRKEFGMVMSHLACADEKDHFMNEHQLTNFTRIKEKYFPKLPAHYQPLTAFFWDMTFNRTWFVWARQCMALIPPRTVKTR